MAIVYFNQATALSLKATVGKTAASTPLRLRLFSNNHTPAVGDTEANYTEVAGGGYAALALVNASWSVSTDDPSSISYPNLLFQLTGVTNAPGTVYGYYVTDADGKALFAERLESPPFTPTVAGDEVIVGLNVTNGSVIVILANKFIVQGTTDSMLTGAQFLGALATGILKVTTSTGVLSVAAAPDFPTLNQNTNGTAANLSGTPTLPNGTLATTQAASDNSTKLATTAYADAAVAAGGIVSYAQHTLTKAELLVLNSTPITIVAGVANKILIPLFVLFEQTITVAYSNNPVLRIKYTGSIVLNGGQTILNETALSLTSAVVNSNFRIGPSSNTVTGANSQDFRGLGLQISAASNVTDAGTSAGTVKVTVAYVTVSL